MSKPKALALFSGGLDSILACRLMACQGVDVLAVTFVTPFFGYDSLADRNYCPEILEKYDINLTLRDVSDEYMLMLKKPAHGYGKHFNPCLDCKIFMMTRARRMMAEMGASFLISGEVVGQRPMSQRRDAMRVVERDSGCDGILLRPLCALRLNETKPEIDGLVDRTRLAGLSGRGRSGQIEMAENFGITDYPTPAGGCMLTDPIVGERIKNFYNTHEEVTVADIRLLTIGRQFTLPDGSWLVIGRKASENPIIEAMAGSDDLCLFMKDRPGPTAVLRHCKSRADLESAAGLLARYAKKDSKGDTMPGVVLCTGRDRVEEIMGVPAQ